jgi:hypothetical protein
MAARGVARSDAAHVERHDPAVAQAQDRVERADPAGITRAPAHRLGPGQALHRLGHQLRQELAHLAAPLADDREQHPRLLVLALLQRVLDAGEAAQEPCPCLLRRVGARAFALDHPVGLALRQTGGDDGQPARRGVAADRLIERETRLGQ